MPRTWPLLVVVFVLLLIVAPNTWSAELDPAALLGNWAGTWESSGGATAGRGDAQITFRSVDGNSVKGMYRLTRSGVPGRGRGTSFIDNEVQVIGRVSANTIAIPALNWFVDIGIRTVLG